MYILSNPSYPGLLKIGCTTRLVEQRVAELNSATGVPSPFTIKATFQVSDPRTVETKIHAELAKYRLNNKEFFRLSVPKAVEIVADLCGKQDVSNPYDYTNRKHGTWTGQKKIEDAKETERMQQNVARWERQRIARDKHRMSPDEEAERLKKWQERMRNRK